MKQVLSIILLLGILSCGRYYSSDVAGYVRDGDSGLGINGAKVRFYNSEPSGLDDDSFIVQTTTMTGGGNAGYYSHKLIWYAVFGTFGDEGDTGEMWLGITHSDYIGVIEKKSGILSGTLNLVSDTELTRAGFSSPLLEGRISGPGGPVNGIRVVMDLASTTENTEDYIAFSRTVNDLDGVFQFENIRWRDESPDSETIDTESVSLYIDDNDYESTENVNNPRVVTVYSDQEQTLTSAIDVTRQARTEFSSTVQGRCYFRRETNTQVVIDPIQGVQVELTYSDDDGVHTLYRQTNNNGYYTFNIDWVEDPPDDEGTGLSIPSGEDVILVTLSFTSNSTTGNIYNFGNITNYVVKTWLGTNTIPDLVDLDPAS